MPRNVEDVAGVTLAVALANATEGFRQLVEAARLGESPSAYRDAGWRLDQATRQIRHLCLTPPGARNAAPWILSDACEAAAKSAWREFTRLTREGE